jgi:hypothetical protein
MIRSKWKTDTRVLDDLATFAGDFDRIAADIGEEVFREMEGELLYELQDYPPPIANSDYVRTMTLKNGWVISFGRQAGQFFIGIENDTSYSKYVVGSLAQARAAAASFQAEVHKGRWVLARDTIDSWFEDWMQRYSARFAKELSMFGKTTTSRRAYTR